MIRIMAITVFSLLATQAHASSETGSGSCASAFVREHLGPEDGATMLRLWIVNRDEPSTTGSVGATYDGQSYGRVSRRFLDLRAQYQVRCPDEDLEFE